VLNHSLPITGILANGYDAGRHLATHPTGNLAVDYTVAVRSPDPVIG